MKALTVLMGLGLSLTALLGSAVYASQQFGAYAYLFGHNPSIAGTVEEARTPSGTRMLVYLPPGYHDSTDRYPVIYHLHGASLAWSWLDTDITASAAPLEQAVAAGEARPKIIVAPFDPAGFSMWADSRDGTTSRSAEIVALVDDIDRRYRTIPRRSGRIIQGFSMGGFGAAVNGLRHQELFAAVVVFDGALHDWQTLTSRRSGIAKDTFGDDEAYFQGWSPWALASQADPARTPFLIVSGSLKSWAVQYRDHLAAAGYDATLHTPDCRHDLSCIQRSHGREIAAFAERHLALE